MRYLACLDRVIESPAIKLPAIFRSHVTGCLSVTAGFPKYRLMSPVLLKTIFRRCFSKTFLNAGRVMTVSAIVGFPDRKLPQPLGPFVGCVTRLSHRSSENRPVTIGSADAELAESLSVRETQLRRDEDDFPPFQLAFAAIIAASLAGWWLIIAILFAVFL